MRTIEYIVLDHDEHALVRRIQHCAGYGLPEGAEREAETHAIRMLGRRNDPMTPEWFDRGMAALKALRDRLKIESDPTYLLESWGGSKTNEFAAKLLAKQRAYQHRMAVEAYDELVVGWEHRNIAGIDSWEERELAAQT